MTAERKGVLYALAFGALFAAAETAASGISSRISLWQVVWLRYAVHLPAVVLIWGRRDPAALIRTQRFGRQILRSSMAFIMPATSIAALSRGDQPLVVIAAFAAVPLLILLMARGLLGEEVRLRAWVSAGLSAAAAVAIMHYCGSGDRLAPLFMTGSAVSLAAYIVLTRLLRDEPTGTNLFYTAVVPFLATSILLPVIWVNPAARDLPSIVATGLIGLAGWAVAERMVHCAPLAVSAPLTSLHLIFILILALAAGRIAIAPGIDAAFVLLVAAFPIALFAPVSKRPAVPFMKVGP